MKKYDYKVDYFHANVSASDVANGKSGAKIAAQVQEQINAHMRNGYELYQQFSSSVEVKAGCLGGLMGQQSSVMNIVTTVYRKELD